MNNTGIKCNKCGYFVIINNEGHPECLCDEFDKLERQRLEPSDHHPWCNFFDRIGKCALCDRLEKFYPVTTEEDFSDLVEKYFPGLMDKWQELYNKDYDEPL